MAFTKVTVPAVDPGNIAQLADRPALSAAQLKAKFDKGGEDVEAALEALAGEINALIDEIEANTSAENVGANPVFAEDASAANVQAKLARLKQYVDDTVVIIGAGDMRKTVYDTDDDGTVNSADEAAKLATARKINGVDFDGTADVTVTAAPTAHTHTKSAITDFPASMPASDVQAWAKAATKPAYNASEVGAVPAARTVNGKALSANIALNSADVRAMGNFMRSDADLNTLVESGCYGLGSANPNMPDYCNYGMLTVSRGTLTCAQIAIAYNSSAAYFRGGAINESTGVWTFQPWTKMLTPSNFSLSGTTLTITM